MAETGRHFTSVSPIDGSTVWQGRESTPAEVAAAMSAAATEQSLWRAVDFENRCEVARRFAAILEEKRHEIGALITREAGKLAWEADAEVDAAIAKVDLSINAARERRSETVVDSASIRRVIRYRPLGVALVLGPFNFPLHLPGGQIIPALLAGNAVVFKPSEQAAAVGDWMKDAWHQAGLPPRLLQVLHGGIEPAGNALDASPLGAVFLTGSRAAGRAIHQRLAGRFQVLLALELGGNNPVLVAGDAPVEETAAVVTFSAFVSAGQRCTCARRLLVVESARTDSLIDALVTRTKSLRLGLPGDSPSPHIGPLISAAAADGLQSTCQRLLDMGCESLVPMRRSERQKNLIHPAVIDASPLDPTQLQILGDMEWFGPMLVIRRCRDMETATDEAAATPYGLAAAMFGGSESDFVHFRDRVGAGVVNWNRPTTGAAGSMPFGGLGESGNHRPAGYFATDFCSDPIASLQAEGVSAEDPWQAAE